MADSHIRTDSSSPPLASVVPAGLNAKVYTALVCPVSLLRSLPVGASHSHTTWSALPVATVVPSGLNDTAYT